MSSHFWSVILLVSLVSTVFGNYCPDGFQLLNNQKCVKLFPNKLKHLGAEGNCRNFGGTLAMPKNSIDDRVLSYLASESNFPRIWLGISCFQNQNSSACLLDDGSATYTSYTNFATGHPKTMRGYGSCVYLDTATGKWTSLSCIDVGMPFACEIPTSVYDPTCEHNYNGNCYTTFEESPDKEPTYNYNKARAACLAQSADLVSILSKQELDFVRNLFKNSETTDVLLGAKASQWSDGSAFNFTFFNPFDYNQGDCVFMDAQVPGFWNKIDCETPFARLFACKRPIVATSKMVRTVENRIAISSAKPKPKVFETYNCSSTLMAPGTITISTQNEPCNIKLNTLGPYQLGIFFIEFPDDGVVSIFNEYGTEVRHFTQPIPAVTTYSNIASISFSMKNKSAGSEGFKASVMSL